MQEKELTQNSVRMHLQYFCLRYPPKRIPRSTAGASLVNENQDQLYTYNSDSLNVETYVL